MNAKPGEAPVIQKIESPKIDMQHLHELFAAKAPPDNTINRIATLEKLVKEQGQRLDGADTEGLHKRMAAVEEKVNKNHELRITTLESEINALKNSLAGMGGKTDAPVDTTQIMVRINMLTVEVNKKVDKSELMLHMQPLLTQIAEVPEKLQKDIQKAIDKAIYEVDRLRAEFE